ncbi:MAG: hypothetical protein QM648_06520 [Solirubrobacterales bacterium]
MDWRRPIEQQKPVSPAVSGDTESPRINASFVDSEEYRAAGSNPDHIEFAIRARAYREQLAHEGKRA